MARAKADDYETKQQVILDAAARLFAQNGYPHSTLLDIAKKSRASKAKVYYYFKSKEDILFQLLHEYCAFTVKSFEGIDESIPPEERLRMFVEMYIVRPPKMRYRHVVLLNDLKYLSDKSRKQIVSLERRMVEYVVSILRQVHNGGEADDRILRTYVLLLFGTINGIDTWFSPSGLMTPAELSGRVAKLYLGAFADSPQRAPKRSRRA